MAAERNLLVLVGEDMNLTGLHEVVSNKYNTVTCFKMSKYIIILVAISSIASASASRFILVQNYRICSCNKINSSVNQFKKRLSIELYIVIKPYLDNPSKIFSC